MEVEKYGKTEEAVEIIVIDDNDVRHGLRYDFDGSLMDHFQQEYPADAADQTEDQQLMIQKVRARANFTIHTETDVDIFPPEWDPDVIETGIQVLMTMDSATFESAFRPYYDALRDPPVDAPGDQVKLVGTGFHIRDGEFGGRTVIEVLVKPPDELGTWVNVTDVTDNGDIAMALPPMSFDFEFGSEFRRLLVTHLKCQMRDLYLRTGQTPPDRYQITGYGKPMDIDAFADRLEDVSELGNGMST